MTAGNSPPTRQRTAFYDFTNVSPRYACVTASMPGYHSATSCKQVTSGNLVYNSIALYPNSDFVDAGPAPDAGAPADASPAAADAAMLADAGDGDAGMGGGGGGGCAASGGNGIGAAFALMLLLLARRVRHTRIS